MTKSRKKSKYGRRRRRQQKGGHVPLVSDASVYPPPPFEPPGGMYKPGGVNGLKGGYYYGVNVNQGLPDPTSTSAVIRQSGGRRRRTRRRKRTRRRRKTRRKRTRRRKRRRRKRRRSRRRRTRRRRQRGGLFGGKTIHGNFKRFLTAITPKDILDAGYQGGRKVGNLVRGYRGERPKMSTNVTVQPVDQPIQTLGYQPINANSAYNTSINTVNSQNTPNAQSNY